MEKHFLVECEDVVLKEVGDSAFNCAESVLRFVFKKPKGYLHKVNFRCASSLLARSEAELLGVSLPRFTYRTIPEDWGFLGIRRIEVLGETVGGFKKRPEYVLNPLPYVSNTTTTPANQRIFQSKFATCESVLVAPQRFRDEGFKILERELGTLFDEVRLVGTPFLNQIRIGYGMCAQAVCLMASLLMYDFVDGIYGIVDITALSKSPQLEDATELDLGGIDSRRIADYFQKIGCSSDVERPSQDNVQKEMQDCFNAIYTYVNSDIPVILPVDLGKFGLRVLPSNNANDFVKMPKTPLEKRSDHALLIVGAARRPGGFKFLCHDPSSLPFIEANETELSESRPFARSASPTSGKLANHLFVSVRPKNVALPLLRGHFKEGKRVDGLFAIASKVQRLVGGLGIPCKPSSGTGVIRLVSREGFLSGSLPTLLELRGDEVGIADSDWPFFRQWAVKSDTLPKYLWVQVKSGDENEQWKKTVWIWDATKEAESIDAVDVHSLTKKYLVDCFLQDSENHWHKWKSSDNFEAVAKTPNISLITSFSTAGTVFSRMSWPREAKGFEYYCLMQPDVDKLAQSDKPVSAVGYLASLQQDTATLKKLSDRTARFETKFKEELEAELVGFASFVPLVTSGDKDERRKGIDALKTITYLAEESCKRRNSPHTFVEIVCGTRVDAIWTALDPAEGLREKVGATIMPEETALDRLFIALESVIDEVSPSRTLFALELEPGPYCVLNNWTTLTRIADRISNSKTLKDRVGFNLDIAHFRIASDVTPQKVLKYENIRERILHAHLSGHSPKGHLGDSELGAYGMNVADYREWVALIIGIMHQQDKAALPFSGSISIEYEAARNSQSVLRSLLSAKKLIDNVSTDGTLGNIYGYGEWQ